MAAVIATIKLTCSEADQSGAKEALLDLLSGWGDAELKDWRPAEWHEQVKFADVLTDKETASVERAAGLIHVLLLRPGMEPKEHIIPASQDRLAQLIGGEYITVPCQSGFELLCLADQQGQPPGGSFGPFGLGGSWRGPAILTKRLKGQIVTLHAGDVWYWRKALSYQRVVGGDAHGG